MIPLWAVAAIAIAAAASAGTAAWKVQDWRHAANAKEAAEDAAQLERERRRGVDTAAVGFEQDRTRTERVVQWVTKEIDREVAKLPAVACLSPDGVRIANAAIDAANGAGEPAAAVPAASAPGPGR